MSEIMWKCSGNEKYLIDNSMCLIFDAGELYVIEYGSNEIVGSCRTEFISKHSVSYRALNVSGKTIKKLAYLLDSQTIRILDLVTGGEVVRKNHCNKIEWLELNEDGTCLLFSDKQK